MFYKKKHIHAFADPWLKQVRRAKWHKWLVFIVCILVPILAGVVNGFFIHTDSYTSERIKNPDWAPPSWVFPPVWTVLYILMGISVFLVYHYGDGLNTKTYAQVVIFVLQLAVNIAWPNVRNGEGLTWKSECVGATFF